MSRYIKDKIKILLSNLCCSQCKNEFDYESLEIISKEKGLFTAELECKKCGKNFGTVFLSFNSTNDTEPLTVVEGAKEITPDEVIDAHSFIRELDEHWQKYLPKNN